LPNIYIVITDIAISVNRGFGVNRQTRNIP